ncbi:low molecular weight protein-tyrosine-phosphatase [Lacrimispora saccharolytica]|uniref:protein-tyrosine-phosphatase n=1 Tax=Lacrimispora saccharolytica (strain ATCC 35040 / DSM 2544 / NRCC 2533 / WM1) TaxID=610130 RepID=D9R317_LACSW|nr:low molecular weight protein-tyrosine-phosphatase [Lacrimispora saccharolytica]ADL03007.1 protein tyrosine phosphatase [[Clostridium] saccharolyticum WM1]QRV18807.1 low molecular weight phosphotyrosine protein phosphatase [Lacrimispora saccharolytica]
MKREQNVIRILMVCLGNICRSPMAEFVMKDIIEKKHLSNRFFVASAATSTEEIGNPVHRGTREKLKEHGITTEGKYAVQLSRKDYDKYDYLIGMEQRNVTNMLKILGGDPEEKVRRLMDFSVAPRDIADPWYTGDFDRTYDDIYEGCQALLAYILKKESIKN